MRIAPNGVYIFISFYMLHSVFTLFKAKTFVCRSVFSTDNYCLKPPFFHIFPQAIFLFIMRTAIYRSFLPVSGFYLK